MARPIDSDNRDHTLCLLPPPAQQALLANRRAAAMARAAEHAYLTVERTIAAQDAAGLSHDSVVRTVGAALAERWRKDGGRAIEACEIDRALAEVGL